MSARPCKDFYMFVPRLQGGDNTTESWFPGDEFSVNNSENIFFIIEITLGQSIKSWKIWRKTGDIKSHKISVPSNEQCWTRLFLQMVYF